MTDEEIYEMNKQMKSQGYTEKEIADAMGMSVYKLKGITRDMSRIIRVNKIIRALELKEQGYSSSAIGREMEMNESSVRRLLEESNKLEYHREIETKKMQDMLNEGYDYSYIACKLGCDETHVKWVLCDEETITPAILEIVEELLNFNLVKGECRCSDILFELNMYYHDSYNITEEIIDYIVLSNGYTLKNDYIIHYKVYVKP